MHLWFYVLFSDLWMLQQIPEVKTENKVYLFVTSSILINTGMNLMRDLTSARGDSIRDTYHLMILVGTQV